MGKYYLGLINAMAEAAPETFVKQCNENYLLSIENAVNIIGTKNKDIIVVAGPSSGGKTTTAKLLGNALLRRGIPSHIISLDDFFLPSQDLYPRNPDGSCDYECVDALDLPLIGKCLNELEKNGESDLPVYDFNIKGRSDKVNHITREKDGVIIVEGIHGLNPRITELLPPDALAKIYINLSSRIHTDSGEILFRKRELRFLRRLVRDFNFRSTGAYDTFEIWEKVCAGEQKYIFPFRNTADIKLDTFHPCEIGMLAGEAEQLIENIKGTEFEKAGLGLASRLRDVAPVDTGLMGEESLMHEFFR